MEWLYKEDGRLVVKTDQHIPVEFQFHNGEWSEVYIGETEFYSVDDSLQCIFLRINNKFISVIDLGSQANADYDTVMKETEREAQSEYNNTIELMSPYLTGRI